MKRGLTNSWSARGAKLNRQATAMPLRLVGALAILLGLGLAAWAKLMRQLLYLTITILLPVLARAATQNWTFVESVGGLTVADAVQVDGHWLLPIQADVSGLHSFSKEPTTMNSGMSCSKVVATVRGMDIFLSIVTGLGGAGKQARCPDAKLGALPHGEYTVFYRGPDNVAVRIRAVSIGL